MIKAEDAIDKYYEEKIDNWNKLKIINIDSFGKKLSLNIRNDLQSKVSYQIKNLNKIWEVAPKEDLLINPDGGITKLTKLLYETNKEFKQLYKEFSIYLLNKFGKNFAIQRQPTIRVHSSSTSNYFCPYWHSDLLIGHPVGTLNIWIPLTNPHKSQSNGFSICSPELSKNFYFKYRKKFTPYQFLKNNIIHKSKKLLKEADEVKASIGEAIVFDSRCFHSAIPMLNHSRVSIDIRIINKKYLEKPYPIFRGHGRKKAKFDLENYYISL